MARTFLILVLSVSLLTAAKTKAPALPAKYAKWLNEEAVYIITDEERKAFVQLLTDPERDSFIQDFWDVRNPNRGSKENPFKEEHYSRIEFANQTFGRHSNTPGWMTDMGRTYILFGKPESKVNFTGYSQIYPLELWFYSNKTNATGLPPFFYALFFIPEDIGEYRFYHPIIDGPLKLVRGTRFNSNRDVYKFLQPLGGDIAHAIFSLIPSDPIDTAEFNPNMSGEMLVSKFQNFANDPFNVRRIREARALRARVSSYLLVSQENALDVNSIVLSDPLGQYWLDYSVWIRDEKLGKPDDKGNLIVSAGYRLSTESGQLIVEDSEERAYPAFDEAKKFRPFQLANRIPLIPGEYRLEVQVANREAGKIFKQDRKISVAAGAQAGLSGPLLAAAVKPARKPDPAAPFQYYGAEFLPAVERRVSRRDPVSLLFQLHGAADYQIEYVIAHAQIREIRRSVTDPVTVAEFHDGSLLKSKTLPLTGLEPGDYRMVLSIRAKDSPIVLASSTTAFKIEDEAPQAPLYLLAHGGVAAYVRALESVAAKDSDGAARYLRQALDLNPAQGDAGAMLVQLYFNGRKYTEISGLYQKLGITPFHLAPETLAQISLSLLATGNAAQAREVMEQAESYFPKNPVLAATAKKLAASAR